MKNTNKFKYIIIIYSTALICINVSAVELNTTKININLIINDVSITYYFNQKNNNFKHNNYNISIKSLLDLNFNLLNCNTNNVHLIDYTEYYTFSPSLKMSKKWSINKTEISIWAKGVINSSAFKIENTNTADKLTTEIGYSIYF